MAVIAVTESKSVTDPVIVIHKSGVPVIERNMAPATPTQPAETTPKFYWG